MKHYKQQIKRKGGVNQPETLPSFLEGKEYVGGVGRRKEATAKARVYMGGNGRILINGKDLSEYFTTNIMRELAKAPLVLAGRAETVDVSVFTNGGGKQGQADATRLAIARALLELDKDLKTSMRKAGHLTRDARVKERKKPGLRRARRAPQWSKR